MFLGRSKPRRHLPSLSLYVKRHNACRGAARTRYAGLASAGGSPGRLAEQFLDRAVSAQGVYGPTPSLVKQLENAAPADIFFSADVDWMNEAVRQKLVDPQSRVDLLSSKLVLIAPAASAKPVAIASGFPLAAMLGDGRLAMCDPMMMPAGRYARVALQKLGVWNSVKDRVVTAADIRAALAYVSRSDAPLGIVFDTDAKLDPAVAVIGTFPADTHPPILYPIAAVARSRNPGTARLLDFLTSPAVKPIFEKFGYVFLPKGA